MKLLVLALLLSQTPQQVPVPYAPETQVNIGTSVPYAVPQYAVPQYAVPAVIPTPDYHQQFAAPQFATGPMTPGCQCMNGGPCTCQQLAAMRLAAARAAPPPQQLGRAKRPPRHNRRQPPVPQVLVQVHH